MIIVLRPQTKQVQIEELIEKLEKFNIEVDISKGRSKTILVLRGDTTFLDANRLKALPIVADIKIISDPYRDAARSNHLTDSVIAIGDLLLGNGNFQIIAGPCSVESAEQIISVAKSVKEAGASMLRGGAFKPRTSPYAFQGLREQGIDLLLAAKKASGLPIVSEIMEIKQLPLFDDIDILQVGARNMQNFELLKELGHCNKPILLKRGLANTLQELLLSAEYIMSGGNTRVILCERGIRTFETATRNTLDLSAIPMLKSMTHLPIIVDPSHATGYSELVAPMSLAAVAAGADGLMIEVHNHPASSLSDGQQALSPEQFTDLCRHIELIRPFAYKY